MQIVDALIEEHKSNDEESRTLIYHKATARKSFFRARTVMFEPTGHRLQKKKQKTTGTKLFSKMTRQVVQHAVRHLRGNGLQPNLDAPVSPCL